MSSDSDRIIVTEFKESTDGVRTPDHDPHGESQASAALSGTTCDWCDKYGYVPTGVLEDADGIFDGVEKEVICSECGGET